MKSFEKNARIVWRTKSVDVTRVIPSLYAISVATVDFLEIAKELRIESRAIFVLDKDYTIKHVEYVKEVADHPNYESALGAARSLLQ